MNSRNKQFCPYCGVQFPKPPTRKIICSSCKEPCSVRRSQSYFNSDILRSDQTQVVDFLEQIRAPFNSYSLIETDLIKRWKISTISPHDVAWNLANSISLDIAKKHKNDSDFTQMFLGLKMLSRARAEYLFQRGLPDKGKDQLRQAALYDVDQQMQLLKYHKDITFNFTIATKGCCSACSYHEGESYSPEALKNNWVLPYEDCSRAHQKSGSIGWCVCMLYAKIIDQ